MTHEGRRGRRKSTMVGVSIVLGIVALMLAITAYVTQESRILIVAVALLAVALVLSTQARKDPQPKPPDKETDLP